MSPKRSLREQRLAREEARKAFEPHYRRLLQLLHGWLEFQQAMADYDRKIAPLRAELRAFPLPLSDIYAIERMCGIRK